MLVSGAERIFTGDAGTITYLLLVLLASLAYLGRVMLARTGWRCLRDIGAGFFLLLASRLLYVSGIVIRHPAFVLLALASGLTGLYLVLVSVIAGGEGNSFAGSNRRALLSGCLSGAVLGGLFFFGILGKVPGGAALPLLYSFASFVPFGVLLCLFWEARELGFDGRFLPCVSGLFLVSATFFSGVSILGLTGPDPFWMQLFSLLDLAGFFLLLVSPVVRLTVFSNDINMYTGVTADGQKFCGGTGVGDAERFSVERFSGIDRMIAGGAESREVYNEIVRAILEDTAAEFAILRIADSESEHLEVVASEGLQDEGRAKIIDSPVTVEDCSRVCRDERAFEGGYFIGMEELGDQAGTLVPPDLDWKRKVIFVFPVMENEDLLGLFTVGLFDSGSRVVSDTLGFYSGRVIQIVQRERIREHLRERERTLAICREELDSVNQLKSNFLSIVSHELRTPLTSVKAYTETLLDNIGGIKRETIQDFLRVMDEENERLIKLVDNMLNYSCMETGHLKVEKTTCNMNEMIEEVYGDLQEMFFAGKVNSDIRLTKKPVVLNADRELIRQLFQNLMSNAVKFTPPGGKVTVVLEEEASAARLIVQDTGRGIPEDQLEKIFERFHQVDTSDTREHGGSGLGLAICKNIVEWHEGKIWVENVKEAGAKFVVLLPMKDIVVRQAAAAGYIGSIRFERERYLSLLVEMLSEFLQARKSSIMLLDRDQQILRVVAAKGLDPEFVQNTRLEVGDRIAGHVVSTGKPLHVFDIEKDLEFRRANNSAFYGSNSFSSVPLKDSGEIVGVLNVSDQVEGREFTEADRKLLEALSFVIVGMLKKLDAYEKVSSNFEKLKDAMRSILDIREAWGSKNLSNLTILALTIGERLNLDEKSLTALRLGMNIYDLGMMKVPRSIRGKKEELAEKEWEKLMRHPDIGYSLVSPMGLEERIMKIVRSHHENFDGTGYPDGIAAGEIPIEARIVNIVDTFRALITQGPYRRCFSVDEARNEIIKGAGTKFDPQVVGAFVKALHDLGARDDKCELILNVVERELREAREERSKAGGEQQMETVKEETP